MSTPSTYFCYTVNRNYALPTLLSAIQARSKLDVVKADVAILYVGRDDGADVSRDVCDAYGIRFQRLDPDELEGEPIHLTRHMLHKFVPAEYSQVVHVDGDTQIESRLDPFVEAPLETGRILAVPDPMALMAGEPGRTWKAQGAYFGSIGLRGDRIRRYVNTGIFRLARSDLDAVGRECRRLCRANPHYVFSEQDALNVAFGDGVAHASFRWNYPAFFGNFDFGHLVEPRLRHFMSNPRPWHGAFMPWGVTGHEPYRDLVKAHPELRPFLDPVKGLSAVRYALQQRYKSIVEPRTWNRPSVKAKLAEAEASAVV